MASTTDFRPSSVHKHTMLKSSFGHAEAELAAMYVTNYLSAQDAGWDTEFTWYQFAQWLQANVRSVNELYQEMYRMYKGPQFVVNGIHELVNDGHMARRDADGETYFRVTDSFVAVMRRYA